MTRESIHLLGANVREGATRRAEEPLTPQGPGLSSGTRKGEGGRVRNLAYLASEENDQFCELLKIRRAKQLNFVL